MSPHPASYKLEGHAAGDHDPEVARHLAECEPCNRYVERSIAFALADESPFPLGGAMESRAGGARPGRAGGRVLRIAFALAPLAAAAAIALFVRHPSPEPGATGPEVYAARFKGGIQLAVVRERAGHQERMAASVPIRASDRLRVEIAVDRERPVTVGVLANDGSWVMLLAPTLLGPGTHLSDRAASVDEHPTDGVILAGEPEAVEKARATRLFSEVAVVPITPEP